MTRGGASDYRLSLHFSGAPSTGPEGHSALVIIKSRVRRMFLRFCELQQNHSFRFLLRHFKSPLLDRFYGALLKYGAATQQLG